MKKISEKSYEKAAAFFAAAFIKTPIFRTFAPDEAALTRYFESYLLGSKGIMLYEDDGIKAAFYFSETYQEGYAFDTPSIFVPEACYNIERFYRDGYAVLDMLAVAPDYRGRGLAGKAIDFFAKEAVGVGALPLTEIFEPKHIPLYEAHGFFVAHRIKTAWGESIIMQYNGEKK